MLVVCSPVSCAVARCRQPSATPCESTSPACHPETILTASAILHRHPDRSLPQPAGTVRAEAEVQTRADCGGGGGFIDSRWNQWSLSSVGLVPFFVQTYQGGPVVSM